ncbi:hypothetical protein [Brachybacterium epidermidis]|uniref:hypothetical protein n=1 Tax=Brachybacterium epidermidis TaxID=2781983 RepID=UPI00398E5B80
MSFMDAAEAYALDPTPENLAPLHRAIMDAPSFDPLTLLGPVVAPRKTAGDHQGIIDELNRLMPGLFLSPAAHMHLSQAHAALGDDAAAQRERRFALLAMHSIREGATGSEDAPFPVLRVEDEYTVLEASGQRSSLQRYFSDQRGHFDIHTVEDGSEVWFRLLWRGDDGR